MWNLTQGQGREPLKNILNFERETAWKRETRFREMCVCVCGGSVCVCVLAKILNFEIVKRNWRGS
jgi:hypothetical protein